MSKFKNIVRWAKITKAGSDDKQFATQQMTYLGKVADGVMVFPYGFHANAAPDSLALMFAIQGNPDNRAAIPWDHKNRPKLASGEVAFYHPSTDAFIIWRASGDLDIETGDGGTADININCKTATVTASEDVNVSCDTATVTATDTIDLIASTSIDFTAPLIKVNGAFEVTGATTFGAAVTNLSVNIGSTHTHTQANDSGGNTEQDTGGPQ